MAAERPRRRKRSVYLDEDVLAWLQRRAEAEDRSTDYFIREILRAAMGAAMGGDEDTSEGGGS